MPDLGRLFAAHSELLLRHRPLWAESAFTNDRLSWHETSPELSAALDRLSCDELERLEQEEDLIAFTSRLLPDLGSLSRGPEAVPSPSEWKLSESQAWGIPSRKKQQVEGFVSALLASEHGSSRPGSVVDWCSGRGHLARALHRALNVPVVCLERDRSLHRDDDSQAVTFLPQDVLEALEPSLFGDSQLHTALHACGDLHLSMLQQTAHGRVAGVACAPCCYHFTRHALYQGLSRAARASGLSVSRDELRLATAETTTANALERKLRQRERLWRVAMDLHLRQLRGVNTYTRTPSVRKSLLKTDFNTFAQAIVDQLERKGRRDFDFYPLSAIAQEKLLEQAELKLSIVARREKAQLSFRGVLEQWLLLDRALYLQEHGYRVEIRRFCDKHQSARNHLLLACL